MKATPILTDSTVVQTLIYHSPQLLCCTQPQHRVFDDYVEGKMQTPYCGIHKLATANATPISCQYLHLRYSKVNYHAFA